MQITKNCGCNQGRLSCDCKVIICDPLNEQGRACDPAQVYTESNETIPGLPRPFVSIGGTHASPMPLPVRKRILMTRLRAICYALGLVFGAALIAVAVFGIGQ